MCLRQKMCLRHEDVKGRPRVPMGAFECGWHLVWAPPLKPHPVPRLPRFGGIGPKDGAGGAEKPHPRLSSLILAG